jgi:hypothetical protein
LNITLKKMFYSKFSNREYNVHIDTVHNVISNKCVN